MANDKSLKPKSFRINDATADKFKEIFTIYDVFLISWKQFLTEVNNLGKYGKYILTAPKLCGLSNEYDQDWNVLCIDKNTLKATIIKTYYKEEE